jgi:hypothetical protein
MDLDKPEENRIEIGDENKESFTEWANEPSVRDFKQDYTDASSDRDDHIGKIDTWLANLNVTGAAKQKKRAGRSSITPKLIRKQAEWRYAALSEPFLGTDDIFNTDPVSYEDKKAAIQNGLVLNNQFNTKIQKQKFIDEYVRTIVDEGTVFVFVGWDFEEEELEVPNIVIQPVNNPAVMQKMQQIGQKIQGDPNFLNTLEPEVAEAYQLTASTGVPHAPIEQGTKIITKTIKNQPTLEIVNYNNLTIDPTARGDMDNASFVIRSFEASISELKRDGKYKNLDEINIENNTILGEPDHVSDEDSNFNFEDKARKKFVVYEYWGFWDVEGDEVLQPIVAAYVGDVLIRLEENPFPDKKLPFVAAQYLPVRRSMYGEPDGELLKENQDIIGAVTRGMIDVMGRSANGQIGRRKDALDVTNRRKFDAGEDYEYNAAMDPRLGFHTHTFPEIPQSAQYMLAAQGAEAESLTGVRPFAQSQGGNIGSDTAAGVRSASDAASKRELGILRRLGEGVKQIGRKIISMNAEFLDEVEIVRVTNEEFIPVRRDDLAGNFDLKLSISTAEADNAKAEELSFMMQTTAQSMGPAFAQIIMSDIARLRKMPELAKKIETFQPQPDPLEEEEKRLKVELLKAQIANEYAKANENNANAELDKAKVGNLNSDSDLKNLDFLEQESGTKQERDLQKQGAQAEGNIKLEAFKHLNKVEESRLKPKTAGAN